MKHALVVTVVGNDRPGIVDRLATVVAAHGADWLESHMASVAGRFAGIVHVEVERHMAQELTATLRALGDEEALDVGVEAAGAADPAGAAAPGTARTLSLALTGLDHPGIVRDIAHALAAREVGIVEFETERVSGSMSGERLFRARARLALPEGLDEAALDEVLQAVSTGLMVDIELEVEEPAGSG